jgi:hypothetical protein
MKWFLWLEKGEKFWLKTIIVFLLLIVILLSIIMGIIIFSDRSVDVYLDKELLKDTYLQSTSQEELINICDGYIENKN